MTAIRIHAAVVDAMTAHARRELPRECCGLLIGTPDLIDEAFPARNTRESTTRYEVHPEDHFAAIRLARQTDRTVVGAYHSHPRGPDHPSETDLAEARDSSLLYVIVSLAADLAMVRAFHLEDGNFTTVALVPLT